VPQPRDGAPEDETAVPRALRVAAAWSWRLLVIGTAATIAVLALSAVKIVILPIIGALLLCTFLVPPTAWLAARGVPRSLASLTMVVALIAAIGALGFWMTGIIRGNAAQLGESIREGGRDLERWIASRPFGIEPRRVDDALDRVRDGLLGGDGIAGGVLARATTAAEIIGGILLLVVLLFFFLKDGDRMWAWLVRRLGADAGRHADAAGHRAWQSLGGYMRGQAIIAFVDAVFIGLGAFILGVPFALPIALITFVAGFFPIVGAVSAGVIAVLIALAAEGLTTAIIMLVIVVGVQQVESNALEPIIMSRTVRLHPVAILVALGAGAAIGGLIGAFLAVPVAAATTAAFGYLWAHVGPDVVPEADDPEGATGEAPGGG
jgi:putative heme transporter